jgi:hypothetical protein
MPFWRGSRDRARHLYSELLNATVTADVALDTSRDVKTLTVGVAPGSSARRIEVTKSALPTALLDVVSAEHVVSWLDPRSVEPARESLSLGRIPRSGRRPSASKAATVRPWSPSA